MKSLTPELLQAATGCSKDRAAVFFRPVVEAMAKFLIDGLWPTAAFLAQVTVESAGLSHLEESLYYKDPERLAKVFRRVFDTNHDKVLEASEIEACKPYLCGAGDLSKLLYGGYHGRGLLGLTWQRNYAAASLACDADYVNEPDRVKEPKHAALTAAWFFGSNGCCQVAGDIDAVTRIINPAMMAAGERRQHYIRIKELLA